jgi:hypothetical protein
MCALLVAPVLLSTTWGVGKNPNDLCLVGKRLPGLGHFDKKCLKLEIRRGARFLKATRSVSLILFCERHCHWRVVLVDGVSAVPDRVGGLGG